MFMKRYGLKAGLVLIVFLLPINCKKNPITSTINPSEQAISLVGDSNSAGPDTVVTFAIGIMKNAQEVRVFGLELTFDPQMFQFQNVGNGNLTANWAAVDGNEISSGTLRIGGFVGGGTTVAANSQGTLAIVRLKVTGASYGNGQQSQICIRQYTDDIASYQPVPACTTFTLKK